MSEQLEELRNEVLALAEQAFPNPDPGNEELELVFEDNDVLKVQWESGGWEEDLVVATSDERLALLAAKAALLVLTGRFDKHTAEELIAQLDS